MPKFKICYGLSRINEAEEIIEAETLEEAETIAHQLAIEIVDSWLVCEAEPVDEDEENEDA